MKQLPKTVLCVVQLGEDSLDLSVRIERISPISQNNGPVCLAAALIWKFHGMCDGPKDSSKKQVMLFVWQLKKVDNHVQLPDTASFNFQGHKNTRCQLPNILWYETKLALGQKCPKKAEMNRNERRMNNLIEFSNACLKGDNRHISVSAIAKN